MAELTTEIFCTSRNIVEDEPETDGWVTGTHARLSGDTAGKALMLAPQNCDSDYHPNQKFE